jgi:cytochrome P450
MLVKLTTGGKLLIPAGTTIIPNIRHIVNNPKEFPGPKKFNKDRFLDCNEKYIKHDHNIIFSIGKSVNWTIILCNGHLQLSYNLKFGFNPIKLFSS